MKEKEKSIPGNPLVINGITIRSSVYNMATDETEPYIVEKHQPYLIASILKAVPLDKLLSTSEKIPKQADPEFTLHCVGNKVVEVEISKKLLSKYA